MKPIDIIQCDPTVPVGVFGVLLTKWQVAFRITRPAAGEPLPADTQAVIILGGTMGVHDAPSHPFLPPLKTYMAQAVSTATPLLGICLGAQLLADVSGGVVSSNRCGEQGLVNLSLTAAGLTDPLFAGCDRQFQAFQWHNDSFSIPPGALHLAVSTRCCGQGFRISNAWGLQFHPEVDRQIVAAWTKRSQNRAEMLDAFAVAEAEHLCLAKRLLANFLRVAGQRSC
jgi:GMP synthase-like glutamine amidotransferase